MSYKKQISEQLRSYVAQRIKSKRTSLNMTQDALVQAIGYRSMRQIVDNWEREATLPPLSAFYLMSIVFDCPIQELLPSTDELAAKVGIKVTQMSINVIIIDEKDKASQ